MRKSRIRIFLEKGGILVIPSVNVEKRGYFWCTVFYREKGGSFGLKSHYFTTKKGVILDWKVSVLLRKRGHFELKSERFATKKGVIFKLENKDGYHFFQWVREPGFDEFCVWYHANKSAYDLAELESKSRTQMFECVWDSHKMY